MRWVFDRIEKPAIALAPKGRILIVNSAMAALLGRKREDLAAENWFEIAVPRHEARESRDRLERAVRQRESLFTCSIATSDGRALELTFALEIEKRGTKSFVVAIVVAYRDATAGPRECFGTELTYDVDFSSGRPLLKGVITPADRAATARPGAPCHQVLYDSETVCIGCPVVPPPPDDRARTGIIVYEEGKVLAEVCGRRINSRTVRVWTRPLRRDFLARCFEALVRAEAKRARLSERERQVLNLLILGRSAPEVGIALGITARTAKFHQANVLRKLGAESRLDLLRLLF